MKKGAHSVAGVAVRKGREQPVTRALPEEVPVALVYNGSTQAVMMATPDDLHDFAVGFSLSEGIITDPVQIMRYEIVKHGQGLEAQMWLSEDRAEFLAARRRFMAGPVGCGLCGIDSLAQALRHVPSVISDLALDAADIPAAMSALRAAQPLHDQTRAVHAAGFYVAGQGIVVAREDVGRHNALDKVIGAMARAEMSGAVGAIALTSRVSVEMVQKCAAAGSPVLIAVSAPTVLAVQTAQDAGITIAALARDEAFEIFTHSARIKTGATHHVA